MYTMVNNASTFLKLIDGHDDPLVPLLRHNVLNHYRNFLAYMVEFQWDDELILRYMKCHEELMIIKTPVNDIEVKQNLSYMNYAYNQTSLRTMLSTIKGQKYHIPKTISHIYEKILENPNRFLNIEWISLIKTDYPELDYTPLVRQYYHIERHTRNYGTISSGIKFGVIHSYNINEILECVQRSNEKIDKNTFMTILNGVNDENLKLNILRFCDKMTLFNKWI